MDDNVQGTVKWFNTNKGFGFLLTEDGREVFVHYTDILTDGFRNLSEGESVRFTITNTGKGLRATKVIRSE
ncbi:MAG: cold shock domain-containing protein [Anaerolineaceae bacterium]|nr:cold shock domain-containing protein [bacterium]MBQ4513605.1 cold shock domain-containing protein [Anaerolineaceae bacterium]